MAGKPNPQVQEALAMLAADPGLSIYEAAKRTGANQQSLYSAARRKKATPAQAPQATHLYSEIERYIKAGGDMREGARATLEYLNRVLAEADAEDAEAFDRVIGDGLPDFIE